jgi:WD40 repeat protein
MRRGLTLLITIAICYFLDAGEPVAFIDGRQTILTFWQPATEDLKFSQLFSCPLEVSAHGGFLLTQEKGRIKLWDAASGQLVEKLDAARQPASFSPDRRWPATGGKEKNVMLLWEVSGH